MKNDVQALKKFLYATSASSIASIASNLFGTQTSNRFPSKKRKGSLTEEEDFRPYVNLRSVLKQDPEYRFLSLTKKNETDQMAEYSQHNDLSHAKLRISMGAPKKLYKKLGKWTIRWDNIGTTNQWDITGMQTAVDVNAFFTRDYSVVSSSTNRFVPYSLNANIFDLNPYQKNTGGAIIAQQTNPVPDYVHIHDLSSTYIFTNFSSVPAYCEVIWYCPSHDISLSPSNIWTNAIANKALGQGASALVNFQTVSAGGGYPRTGYSTDSYYQTTGAWLPYGMSPEAEKEFRSFYTRLKTHKFTLQGGDTHKVSLLIEFNKTMSKAFANDNDRLYYKGRTVFCMMIVRPGLVWAEGHRDQEVPPLLLTPVSEPIIGNATIGWNVFNKMNVSSLGGQRLEYDRLYNNALEAVAENNGGTATAPYYTLKQVNDVDAEAVISNVTK